MKYNLDQVVEMTGAGTVENFKKTFSGLTATEVNEILIDMFGSEGDDIEFAEEIVRLAK